MQTQQLINQIDDLLKDFERAKAASPHDDLSGGLPKSEMVRIRARLFAGVKRLAPSGTTYLQEAQKASGHDGQVIMELAGILSALKDDYQAGYTYTVEELVHGELFDDFLEMATELERKGYKDPAAVIAGSVLEEHIRKLATRNQIPLQDANGRHKSFDSLAIELVKLQQISEPQRKILVAWYGLRSEAAHGHYENVTAPDVQRMIGGIRDFMVRLPA